MPPDYLRRQPHLPPPRCSAIAVGGRATCRRAPFPGPGPRPLLHRAAKQLTSPIADGVCFGASRISKLTVNAHPSRQLIAGYASGTLPLGPSLAVRLHLEACSQCELAVAELEEAEAQLLLSLPGVEMQPGALQGVLDLIEANAPAPSVPRSPAFAADIQLPAAIAEIGLSPPVHLTPDAWVAHLDAPRFGGWRTYLFCAPAETALPSHGHLGDELIVVLEGAFSDGRDFRQGDFAENRSGFVHGMQVSREGRLVALISSGGPIEWRPSDQGIGALLDI